MPKLKIDHVVSFSSEDSAFTANNVLSCDSTKKWKSQNAGERSASIVLQLEKASVISGIDIGNEHSAYIEVLAGRSCSSEDYKVLLVMSSFMTPLESRQSQNVNKVRMFTQDQLQKPECEEKWDRVKIVCTQPFNRYVQYGLAFITLHSPGDKGNVGASAANFGKFALRPSSPDNLSAGSIFARRKDLSMNTTVKAAAAIRDAASLSPSSSLVKPKIKPFTPPPKNETVNTQNNNNEKHPSRNRNQLLYDKDEEEPNEKIDQIIDKKTKETKEKQMREIELKNKEKERKKQSETERKDKQIDTPSKIKNVTSDNTYQLIIKNKNESNEPSTSSNKRKADPRESRNKKPKIDKQRRPFHHLLNDVVFVISGIQNPDRAEIRQLALEMGAKYKPDWTRGCTHLICAFRNTPKFNQVKRRKGKIVKRTWISDCHSQRKRLPWRRYALDRHDQNQNESEDEIWEEIDKRQEENTESHIMDTLNDSTDTEDEIDRIQNGLKSSSQEISDDNSDTESEIEKIQRLQESKPDESIQYPYNEDTDDENIQKKSGKISKKLPNLFSDEIFYIDKNLDDKDILLLTKYITAYNGILIDDLSDVVDWAVSSSREGVVLKELCPKARIISPSWVWECHNRQQRVSVDSFLIN